MVMMMTWQYNCTFVHISSDSFLIYELQECFFILQCPSWVTVMYDFRHLNFDGSTCMCDHL